MIFIHKDVDMPPNRAGVVAYATIYRPMPPLQFIENFPHGLGREMELGGTIAVGAKFAGDVEGDGCFGIHVYRIEVCGRVGP